MRTFDLHSRKSFPSNLGMDLKVLFILDSMMVCYASGAQPSPQHVSPARHQSARPANVVLSKPLCYTPRAGFVVQKQTNVLRILLHSFSCPTLTNNSSNRPKMLCYPDSVAARQECRLTLSTFQRLDTRVLDPQMWCCSDFVATPLEQALYWLY